MGGGVAGVTACAAAGLYPFPGSLLLDIASLAPVSGSGQTSSASADAFAA